MSPEQDKPIITAINFNSLHIDKIIEVHQGEQTTNYCVSNLLQEIQNAIGSNKPFIIRQLSTD